MDKKFSIYGVPDYREDIRDPKTGVVEERPIEFNGKDGVHCLEDLVKVGYKPVSIMLNNNKPGEVRIYRVDLDLVDEEKYVIGCKIDSHDDVDISWDFANGKLAKERYGGFNVVDAIQHILSPYLSDVQSVVEERMTVYNTNSII